MWPRYTVSVPSRVQGVGGLKSIRVFAAFPATHFRFPPVSSVSLWLWPLPLLLSALQLTNHVRLEQKKKKNEASPSLAGSGSRRSFQRAVSFATDKSLFCGALNPEFYLLRIRRGVPQKLPVRSAAGSSLPDEMEREVGEKYLLYHGLPVPKETHSPESLKFAQDFSFRDDDVLSAVYPKTGTIWMQEILPLVLNAGDLTPIQTIPNWDRVPWLEEKRLAHVVDELPSPRALVTHFPYNLMPPSFHTSKAKVIYVTRNPKDVMVSSYYFHQMAGFLEDPGTFDEFMEKFLEGKVMFGKWTDHVKSWRRSELGDRIMYITYEEMVQDLPAVLRCISDFLDRNLSEEIIHKITEHCSFESMKANTMSNFSLIPKVYMDQTKSPFYRKGIVGDWKNHFSSEQLTRFTSVICKELKGETFSLPGVWNEHQPQEGERGHADYVTVGHK